MAAGVVLAGAGRLVATGFGVGTRVAGRAEVVGLLGFTGAAAAGVVAAGVVAAGVVAAGVVAAELPTAELPTAELLTVGWPVVEGGLGVVAVSADWGAPRPLFTRYPPAICWISASSSGSTTIVVGWLAVTSRSAVSTL